MNKVTSLFAASLLLASASAWSETATTPDLTYCLELKSNADIAKCAGETTSRNQAKPMSRTEVDKLLSQEKAAAPAAPAPAPVAAEPPAPSQPVEIKMNVAPPPNNY